MAYAELCCGLNSIILANPTDTPMPIRAWELVGWAQYPDDAYIVLHELYSAEDLWAYNSWCDHADNFNLYIDACLEPTLDRVFASAPANDGKYVNISSTADAPKDRAEILKPLRDKYDTSAPSGLTNAEELVNAELEYVPVWVSQDGVDRFSPTVIEEAFIKTLLVFKHDRRPSTRHLRFAIK